MAERRIEGLQRVLGVNALFSTAYGNVGSSIYYALGLVASYALGLTPIVFVLTGFIFYLTAATYAEATAMYPEAGGSSSFARHAFNEFWSFFAAWGQMLNYVITIAISAFFVPHYIGGLFWPYLKTSPGDIFVGIAVVAFLCALNVVGVKEAARVNIVLAVTDFATQLLLVVVGGVLVLSPAVLVHNVHLGTVPSWKNFVIAIPVGMIAYTGIETISNMAEEAQDESRTIPTAIKRVVIAVFAIYAALPAVALSALPVRCVAGHCQTLLGVSEDKGGFAGDPVLGIVKHLHLGALQPAAVIYVGLLAATILFIATNAGIIGVSRLVYSMGLHRQLPDGLRRLHPRFRTPWIGILLFGGIACMTLIPGQATFLGNMYAFGAMLSFTIAHISVIRLRIIDPDRERPYRGPGNVTIAGHALPLFAIVGGLGTFLAFVTVTALHLDVAAAGVGWLSTGIAVYVSYRRRQGLDLTPRQGGDPALGRRSRGRVRVGPGRLRRARLLARGAGHRSAAGRAAPPRHPRAGDDLGPGHEPDRRRPARAGGRRPVDHRGGQGAGRPPGLRALGEGPRRPGGAADRRGGTGHGCPCDRDAAGAEERPRAVRPDARDGAPGTALPRDPRADATEAGAADAYGGVASPPWAVPVPSRPARPVRPEAGSVDPRRLARTAIEIVAAVAAATLLVAALQSAAPATTLGVLYLLAVLAIAIRRGELAALVTAVLSVAHAQLLLHHAAPPLRDRPFAGPRRAGSCC